MPTIRCKELDADVLLEELRQKRRWLDAVIAGLEYETDTRSSLLTDAVVVIAGQVHGPWVDVRGESRELLLHLADQVRRRSRLGSEPNGLRVLKSA